MAQHSLLIQVIHAPQLPYPVMLLPIIFITIRYRCQIDRKTIKINLIVNNTIINNNKILWKVKRNKKIKIKIMANQMVITTVAIELHQRPQQNHPIILQIFIHATIKTANTNITRHYGVQHRHHVPNKIHHIMRIIIVVKNIFNLCQIFTKKHPLKHQNK